jgi:hypothetical protein
MSESEKRAAFEAWGRINVALPTFGGTYSADGVWFYNHRFMQSHWECWRAAIESGGATLIVKVEGEQLVQIRRGNLSTTMSADQWYAAMEAAHA